MARSHRNEDRGGERRWTFNGVEYPTRKLMCAARREEYVRLLDEEGMNFTQAAHAVGVSKRTGKAWRNGRTRATGRNEKASMDWYRSTMVYFVKSRWMLSALNLDTFGVQVERHRRLFPCFVVWLAYFMRECLFR